MIYYYSDRRPIDLILIPLRSFQAEIGLEIKLTVITAGVGTAD